MDNQLALMKKLQKDPDTIAYAHNEEIVLIKRVVDDDSVHLTEVTLNPETGSKISERIISDSEMKLSQGKVLSVTGGWDKYGEIHNQ